MQPRPPRSVRGPARRILSLLATVVFTVCVALAVTRPGPALAQDDAADQTTFDRIDAFFGEYLVLPMFKVMFWDIAFWDNTLPQGEGVGTTHDGKKVVAATDDGYELREEKQVSVMAARRILDGPVDLALGDITLRVTDFDDSTDRLTGGTFSGAVAGGELPLRDCADAASCGVPLSEVSTTTLDDGRTLLAGSVFPVIVRPQPPAQGGALELRVLRDRAPFPLVVDVSTGALRLLDHTVHLAPGVLPPRPGDRAMAGGREFEVVGLSGHAVTVQGLETTTLAGALPNPEQTEIPLVVAWLVFGATFFTLRMGFINLRGFGHAIQVTAGKYDDEEDEGEVSHFQALSSALSATVGLGNIAGVALAVAAGGPGAVFWMVVAGFLGMSSKFTECTLGQMYRTVDSKGHVSGGPMHYLDRGLKELGMGPLGKVLAIVFALMCIGGSLGGGNMFQANQSFAAIADVVPAFAPKAAGAIVMERASIDGDLTVPAGTVVAVAADGPAFETLEPVVFAPGQDEAPPVAVQAVLAGEEANVAAGLITEIQGVEGISAVSNPGPTSGGAPARSWLYGILLAFAVGLVILGGIKSIGKVAGIIVPVMCGVYVLAGLWIIITNADQVVWAVQHIVGEAFTPEAGRGGLLGVLIQGFRRAAFSNEAGVGSASIAHSAATTKEPVREGIVALLEPFIDTIIVCSMTGIVVVITGVYQTDVGDGVLMTSAAFGSVIDWFPLVLSFAVVMFAFSTMISWSYYGERCATWLLGEWASLPYKMLFLACVFFGAVFKLGNVLDFSDLMVLGMAFPNILGLLFLSGKVKRALDDYWGRLKSGEMTAS